MVTHIGFIINHVYIANIAIVVILLRNTHPTDTSIDTKTQYVTFHVKSGRRQFTWLFEEHFLSGASEPTQGAVGCY